MKAEYVVDDALGKLGQQSDKIKELEHFNEYNFTLWLHHYYQHLVQMETLRNIGDYTEISNKEAMDLMPETSPQIQSEIEIGNMAPDWREENSIYCRTVSQFSWGSRYMVPFVHSSDNISSVVATMAKLGK